MKTRTAVCWLIFFLAIPGLRLYAQTNTTTSTQEAMDHDLLEVSIPQLQELYRSHKYTVAQVVHWYIARVGKYNGIYRAVQNLDTSDALATAAHEDAEAESSGFKPGPMWGVPVVIKANTSIKGLVTTD